MIYRSCDGAMEFVRDVIDRNQVSILLKHIDRNDERTDDVLTCFTDTLVKYNVIARPNTVTVVQDAVIRYTPNVMAMLALSDMTYMSTTIPIGSLITTFSVLKGTAVMFGRGVPKKIPAPQKVPQPIPQPAPQKVPQPIQKISKHSDNCIDRSKLPLKDYQRNLVKYLDDHRAAIAVWSVGSGKTLLAVSVSQCYLSAHPKGVVIVVTPVSLQDNMRKEIKAYGADPNDKRYLFYTLQGFANKYHTDKCPADALLIIDEAHNLRTDVEGLEEGDKTRAMVAIRCAMTVTKVLLLTATPLYNNPSDILNLEAMVKGTDPIVSDEFLTKDFSTPSLRKLLNDPMAFKAYFEGTCSFYTAPQTDDYPTISYHTVDIPMTRDYYNRYLRIQEVKLRKADGSEKNLGAFLLAVRKASNELGECIKCEWILNKIKEGQKTLVYSFFLDSGIGIMKKLLTSHGIPYLEVTGKLNKAQRTDMVNKYNKGDVKVLFITKAGGEGLDLKGTRHVILMESSWNTPNEEQVIGRARRYKSHHHLPINERHVDVYKLIMVKPTPLDPRDNKPLSADQLLQQRAHNKKVACDLFITLLHPISIEAMSLPDAERTANFMKVWTTNIHEVRLAMAKIAPEFKIRKKRVKQQ